MVLGYKRVTNKQFNEMCSNTNEQSESIYFRSQ